MGNDNSQALVSVADVLFYDPDTDAYLGEGFAFTQSSLVQEVQAIEHRGGYLNGLLYNIKHSKNVTVQMESATFKLEYLAFQTGTGIQTALSEVYKFDECVDFVAGVGTTASTPVGQVVVRKPDGTIVSITPTGSTVNTGDTAFTGKATVAYAYNKTVQSVLIDTKTQPLTVKAVLRVRAFDQSKQVGDYEIIIPKLKFDGSINLSLASDTISTFALGGTALQNIGDCGKTYYAEYKFIPVDDEELSAVTAIFATPNTYALSLTGTDTATATILGYRGGVYANETLVNTDITFVSDTPAIATVDANGLITAVSEGTAIITATYQGLQETINVTVGA